MERPTLVVGIGNALQGADGFGPAVVDRLRVHPDVPRNTVLIDAGTDLLGCLDRLAAADHVIVVDAYVGGAGTGVVDVIDEATFSQWKTDSADAHAISAVVALGVFRRLYPAAGATITLVGLNAACIDRTRPLRADQIDAGVAAVVRVISQLKGLGGRGAVPG